MAEDMVVTGSLQCVCSSEMAPFHCPMLNFSLVSLVLVDEAVLSGASEILRALLSKATAEVTRRLEGKVNGTTFYYHVLQKLPNG